MTFADTVGLVLLGSLVITMICAGPKFFKMVARRERKDATIECRRCIYCGDLLPIGRYSFCEKEECISQFVDIHLEKNRHVYDGLG